MLGVIGGTGLYRMEALTDVQKRRVETPFGAPSAEVTLGVFEGNPVAFLPRHGLHHQFLPSEINYRANIWALKSLGVKRIMSVSAVGSLNAAIRPGDLAIPNQYLDWTSGQRRPTFFGEGVVAHISSSQPTCDLLSQLVCKAAAEVKIQIHSNKTYVCVEGPRLGTRAESFFFKNNGCDLVGMTNVPEVFLALEAQIAYCTLAVVTDYDCWLEDPKEHVSVDKVMALYMNSIEKVQMVLKRVFVKPFDEEKSESRRSLQGALVTQTIPEDKSEMVRVLKL
ncbi:MAG: S-methyl-5'-thioadenosine phosphorylase [Deltaproteobacteria bacterium]|nr:S-methyl-5'-thioadenosine phosphorylase [Deltaproteobacteria bacterium]MBM4317296.1 S-methyl-5'-thioadenosine phosphorylase [Deltaproteobacteria bacterium]